MANNDTSMKKIWATKLTDVSSTDQEGIGAIRFEGAKIYKYIRYNQGTAALTGAAGDAVCYTAYTATDIQVTPDVSDGLGAGNLPAGALVAAMTHQQYGWIQIAGRCVLSTAIGGTPANGSQLTITGAADRAVTRRNDQTAAAAIGHFGIAIDQANRIVVIQCPF